MIHQATQKQIKTKYSNDSFINAFTKEMEGNLERIEAIFIKLGYEIRSNPDGMFDYAGFTWKLEFVGSVHTFIFDVLYAKRIFSIYITRQDLVPKGEEQHYFNPNHLHIVNFKGWVGIDEMESLLTDLVIIFMRDP